jgi:hypothetical protein
MADVDAAILSFCRMFLATGRQPTTGPTVHLRRSIEASDLGGYHWAFEAVVQIKRLFRRWIRSHCVALAILVALATPAAAQPAAVLQGTVFDPTGAVVPAAAVRIQHRDNGTQRAVVADVRGHFEIVALATGNYRIEVQASGFQAQILEPFVVDAARTIVQDFHLTVGDLSQTVTVSARDPLLDRASTAVGHVLNEQFVQGIPLNGRRFVDLGFLLPGSVSPGQGGFLTAPSRGDGFYGFNTAGNREDTINFLVNGVTITEQFNGVPLLTSISTTQEMSVDNATFSAEYGRKSGSVVSMVTQSGTNSLHGEVYGFFRDDALDARNRFSQKAEPPLYHRHQFGARGGGPLIRNRAFVFATYEGQRQQQGLDVNSLVPSDAQRLAALAPEVGQLLRFIPRANLVDAGGTSRFVGSATAPFDSNAWSLDLTMTPAASGRVHAYYVDVRDRRAEPLLQGNTIPGFGDTRQRHRQVLTLNDVRVLRPTLVNEARLGFLRSVGFAAPATLLNPTDLGIRVGHDDAVGLPQISVGGGLNLGGPANTLTRRQGTTFAVSDTISYQRDSHSLRIGGEYRWYNSKGFTRDAGRLNFATMAEFIAGAANAFSITIGDQPADISQNTFGLFAQDQLRLRQNLTMNLGLRADWTMAPTERESRFVVFDPSTASLVRVGTVYDSRLNLQPRVGLAWDLSNDGRTIVRAAYGVYANQPPINMVVGTTTNPPLVTPLSYSGLVGLDNAIDLARATGLAPSTVDPEFRPAATQSWNANLQREVARNVAVMVGYFGATTSGLQMATNINQPVDGVRPFPRLSESSPILPGTPLGNITQIGSSSRSRYRALWVSVRGRTFRRLQLLASYTLSKSSDYNSLTTQGVVAQNSYDVRGELGPSDYDARHRGALTAIYDLPFQGNRLVEGWQISALVQAQSGSPINIVTSSSTINGIPNTVRPDLVAPIRIVGEIDRWFDTSAFVAVNRFGNLTRNAVVGPGYTGTDVSISKTTTLGGMRFELRAECFNLFNYVNLGRPGNIVGSANFGVITNTRYPTGEAGSSRQLQVAAKLMF